MGIGAIVNVGSFSKNPHVKSILYRGLWGFKWQYRKKWGRLDKGTRVLLYGDGGVRVAGYVKERYQSPEPVEEWVGDPAGYPLRIKLDLINRDPFKAKPIERAELVDKYGIRQAKLGFFGRMNLVLFGDVPEATYSIERFDEIWSEFLRINGLEGGPLTEEEETPPLEGYVEKAIKDVKQHPPERWTEDDTKAVLVEPLLRALGWDTYSLDEVERGYSIPVGTTRVQADYALKIGGRVEVLLEAKALARDLDRFVDQTVSYAKLADVRWAILTNGRELRVYDATHGFQLFKLSLSEYLKEKDKLMLLSKESVEEGRLDGFGDTELHRQAVMQWFRESVDVIVEEIIRSNPSLRREMVRDLVGEIVEKIEA